MYKIQAYNTAIGYKAGNTGTNDITTGDENVLIGSSTAASKAAATNQIVIGASAVGAGDNTVQLGNTDITNVKTSGTITAGAITIPNTDGSANQILKTDGSGSLSWTANSGGGAIDGLSDAKLGGTDFTNSIIIGHQTTGTLDAAERNTAVGIGSLDAITSGDRNTAIGHKALTSNTTGSDNTASGDYSLYANTTGGKNTASGEYSLFGNSLGNYNTASGYYSLSNNTTGNYNTASGSNSLQQNTTGGSNTASGYACLLYTSDAADE